MSSISDNDTMFKAIRLLIKSFLLFIALALVITNCGEEKRDISTDILLADSLFQQGQYLQAGVIYIKIIDVYSQDEADFISPQMGIALARLAECNAILGFVEYADSLYISAEQMLSTFPATGMFLTRTLVLHSQLMLSQHRFKETEVLLQQAMEITIAETGIENAAVAIMHRYLGHCFIVQNNADKAIPHLIKELEIYHKIYSSTDSVVVINAAKTGYLLSNESRHIEAWYLLWRIVDAVEHDSSINNYLQAELWRSISHYFYTQGNYQEAERFASRSLKLAEQLYEQKSYHLLKYLYTSATAVSKAEDRSRMNLILLELVSITNQPLLEPDFKRVIDLYRCAELCKKYKMVKEANIISQRAMILSREVKTARLSPLIF